MNDTNILIDLVKADLLRFCPLMSLEFHTLDVIVEEVEDDEQRRAVEVLISDGTLKVQSLSGRQMVTVMEKVGEYDGKCNLSPEDISVMGYDNREISDYMRPRLTTYDLKLSTLARKSAEMMVEMLSDKDKESAYTNGYIEKMPGELVIRKSI